MEHEKKKKVQKVVNNEVTIKKQSELSKLAKIFIPDDIEDVKKYIFFELIVPGFKDLISDAFQAILYGGDSPRSSKKRSYGKTSYENYWRGGNGASENYAKSKRFDYDDILFGTRDDAEEVLDNMRELMEKYRNVSIADMYDLADISNFSFTYNKYGWNNESDIAGAKIARSGKGFVIQLPKPRLLENN